MTSQLPANTEDIPLDRCWELLMQHRIARLAVVHQGEPDIFPVSYVVDHGGIVDASYGSGVSFRDPDNIALEFFAPPAG